MMKQVIERLREKKLSHIQPNLKSDKSIDVIRLLIFIVVMTNVFSVFHIR